MSVETEAAEPAVTRDLADRVAVVTGGARGIASEKARNMAGQGINVTGGTQVH